MLHLPHTSNIDGHLMQFGQFKLSYCSKVLERKYKHCKQYSVPVDTFNVNLKKKDIALYARDSLRCIGKDKLFNVWHDMLIHAKWGEEGFLNHL